MNSTILLPGFEEVNITKMEEVDVRLCLHIELPLKSHICPECATSTMKVHDYWIQKKGNNSSLSGWDYQRTDRYPSQL
jgi:transposase